MHLCGRARRSARAVQVISSNDAFNARKSSVKTKTPEQRFALPRVEFLRPFRPRNIRLESNELVDQVLEEFLAAAGVRGDITLLQHIRFEIAESCLAAFDLRTDAAVP